MNKHENPVISVCVVTFNQKDYIEKCLQSLIDQVTQYEYEIIVADDASTDGTSDIVRELEFKYPKLIKAYIHNENIGPYKNLFYAHKSAKGKYICHMDGDDYAFQEKLQLQAKILDSEPECNIVYHPVLLINQHGEKIGIREPKSISNPIRRYNQGDLIAYGAIGVHSSKMYRAKLREIDENKEFIDQTIQVMQIGNGYCRFTGPEPLGSYRVGIGISSMQSHKTQKKLLDGLIQICQEMPHLSRYVCARTIFEFLLLMKKGAVDHDLIGLIRKTFSLHALIILFRIINVALKFKIGKK